MSHESMEWTDQAVCASVGGNLWFPEIGEPTEPAKAICADCPVRTDCLEYALRNDIRDGVFGGMSAIQRKRLRQVRARVA